MLNEYIKDLEKYRDLNQDNNAEKFESVLGDIARLKDPKCIKKLVDFFDDDSDFHEVLFGIVHLIEEFDDHTYLQELAPSMPKLINESPYWAKVLHYRILNSPATLAEYRALLPSLSNDIKIELKDFLLIIKNEDKEFADRCDQLISGMEL